jgi:hypothetical protein
VDVYVRAGSSPAISDSLVATMLGYWDGTTFKPQAADTIAVGGVVQPAGGVDVQTIKTRAVSDPGAGSTLYFPTVAYGGANGPVIATTANALAVDNNGQVTYNNTAPPTSSAVATAVAAAVLKTPANLLVTDVGGCVTYNNTSSPDSTAIAAIFNVVSSTSYGNAALEVLLNTLVTSAGNLSNLMALENIQGPSQIVTPEAGTTPYQYVMVLKGANNAVADPDNNTTVSVTVKDGSGNLIGSATATWTTAGGLGTVTYAGKLSALTHAQTGWFQFTYTADYNDASPLSLQMVGQATIAAVSRNPVLGVGVFDANTITSIPAALAILQKLAFGSGSGPTYPVLAQATDLSGNALATHGDVEAIPTPPSAVAIREEIDANSTQLAAIVEGIGDIPTNPQLADAAVILPHSIDAGSFTGSFPAAVLEKAPIGNPNANSTVGVGTISEGHIEIYQHGAFANPDGSAISITVSDQNGNPISVAGKTLEMVVYSLGGASAELWSWSTSDALAIGGASSNVIELSADATHSGQAGTMRWVVWDVTAPTAPLEKARGTLTIVPNAGPS